MIAAGRTLGIRTRAENSRAVITDVVVGSVTFEAGVTCGSVIVAVNGRDVSSESHDKIMTAIRNGCQDFKLLLIFVNFHIFTHAVSIPQFLCRSGSVNYSCTVYVQDCKLFVFVFVLIILTKQIQAKPLIKFESKTLH